MGTNYNRVHLHPHYPQWWRPQHLNRRAAAADCGKWTRIVETCSHTPESYPELITNGDNVSGLLTLRAHPVDNRVTGQEWRQARQTTLSATLE